MNIAKQHMHMPCQPCADALQGVGTNRRVRLTARSGIAPDRFAHLSKSNSLRVPRKLGYPIATALVKGHVTLHHCVCRQIKPSNAWQGIFQCLEQQRADPATLVRRLDNQRTNRARSSRDYASDGANDSVVFSGDQSSLTRNVLCYRRNRLDQRWNLTASAPSSLLCERATLQFQQKPGVP